MIIEYQELSLFGGSHKISLRNVIFLTETWESSHLYKGYVQTTQMTKYIQATLERCKEIISLNAKSHTIINSHAVYPNPFPSNAQVYPNVRNIRPPTSAKMTNARRLTEIKKTEQICILQLRGWRSAPLSVSNTSSPTHPRQQQITPSSDRQHTWWLDHFSLYRHPFLHCHCYASPLLAP